MNRVLFSPLGFGFCFVLVFDGGIGLGRSAVAAAVPEAIHPVAPSEPLVTERGPHHKVWSRVTQITRPDGTTLLKTNAFEYPDTSTPLDVRNLTLPSNGVYWVWKLKGHKTIRVGKPNATIGNKATLSAMFSDPPH